VLLVLQLQEVYEHTRLPNMPHLLREVVGAICSTGNGNYLLDPVFDQGQIHLVKCLGPTVVAEYLWRRRERIL
jgi:hypothetical protein